MPAMTGILRPPALFCFAIALLLYAFAVTRPASGAFAFIGGVFELMAWRKWLA